MGIITQRALLGVLLATFVVPAGAEAAPDPTRLAAIARDNPEAPPSSEPEYLYAAPTRLDRIGRIMAPVMINGQGPFRLMVDTGANQSVLTTRVARVLGLVPAVDRRVRLSGVTGSAEVAAIHVDLLETGDLVQRNLFLPVLDSVMGGADGILGMQGFEDKRIMVDFVRDRIEITDSRRQRARPTYVTLPVDVRFGRLLLTEGRVSGVRVQAVIDTGAERTLGNLALLEELQKRKRLRSPLVSAGVVGITEIEQRGNAVYTRRINLGNLDITDLDIIYGDIHVFKLWGLENEPAILVGMDVLGFLEVFVVDYRRKEVHIKVPVKQ
jgi:predicted aspartyl protease